jgi:hypothetical protein
VGDTALHVCMREGGGGWGGLGDASRVVGAQVVGSPHLGAPCRFGVWGAPPRRGAEVAGTLHARAGGVAAWPGLGTGVERWEVVVVVVMRRPGPCALKREGGGGNVAGSRHWCREMGGGGG